MVHITIYGFGGGDDHRVSNIADVLLFAAPDRLTATLFRLQVSSALTWFESKYSAYDEVRLW
jgi:hypothetical protein